MEPVAAGDEVAEDGFFGAVVAEVDFGGIGVFDGDGGSFEEEGAASGEAGGDEVFDDLLLAVDGDAAAGEFGEGDAVAVAGEAQDNAFVNQAFAVHPGADSGVAHLLAGIMFHEAGADAAFDVRSGLGLDDDAVDTVQMQDLGEEEAGGAGADDADLCAQRGVRHACSPEVL